LILKKTDKTNNDCEYMTITSEYSYFDNK